MERRQIPANDLLIGQGSFPGALQLGYPLVRGHWDEMVDDEGSLRPHWEPFVEAFTAVPPNEMVSRWERGQRMIRENGVTYNVYRDPRGVDRPWQLDPVPLIIKGSEWRAIEAGLMQRATLLNAILADLYGPRRLLADGLLPPALVFGHPGYLRPLRNVPPPNGVHLHLYAADLARSPDGQWWVMSERSEAPSGAGYALENRIIVARNFPDMLRQRPVEMLTPFFHKLRDMLYATSPRHRETPRIVLLSPGPYNETFFEHAYLARFLGYTLVEAEDLTVRDERVYLKTLDGLQPVDVILRRTDGAYCDPLELKSDSTLGIAGLVRAVRRGSVVVVNSLGSGLLEGGTLAPFLPNLAAHLLGEELKLPSVATWWCGGGKEAQHVLANLDRMVIKPAFPGAGSAPQPVFGDRLPASRRAELAESIRKRPEAYLAQERVALSTVPAWVDNNFEPRAMMMRVFVTAHEGGYAVMPGGLTRIAAERAGNVVSMQYGGGSKDTWVLDDDNRRPSQPIRTKEGPVTLVRGTHDLPSRVADNLYWFGRYLERVEDTTRLLRAVLSRTGTAASYGAAQELPVALALLDKLYSLPARTTHDAQAELAARMNFDETHIHGLRATVERVHRMALLVRDRLSLDTWRAINRLHEEVTTVRLGARLDMQDLVTLLNRVILASEALSGLAMENMTRGLGWRFVDFGRRLERGMHVLDVLSGMSPSEKDLEGAALDVALEVSDSAMTYRSRYLSMPQFSPVLDLLLADESNPRSLAFQTAALGLHMDQVAAGRRSSFFSAEQRLTIWLCGALRTAEIEVLAARDEDGGRRNLEAFLEVLRSKLWELSETVTREYFTHAVGKGATRTASPRELLP